MDILCAQCKAFKPENQFYKSDKRKRGYGSYCKICVRENTTNYYKRNPEHKKAVNRKYDLMKLYGVSLPEYIKLFEAQKGCCAICGKHQSEFKRRLCQDHNHEFGFNRGLLCHMCNLGTFGENIAVLQSAISYFREWEI